ncbi:hypothetical protein [Streptomyces rishiriensis]|uniref:hypothetical protein n=1 Tax=Streptomyces rishiriensis TaxID=68264 RepID=UPI0037D68020
MTRPGPALCVGLLGVTVTLVGYALFAAWLGVHARLHSDARDRATATATGVVVEDGIGDDEDVRVRWKDDEGRTHVQRFGVYDTGRYTRGERFRVAYAPGDSRGFPADPDETAAEDDLIVPVFLGAAVALPLSCVWIRRGLRFRLTARRPGRPMTARVRFGSRRATIWRGSTTTWLELTAPDGTVHWQRVMWHPAAAAIQAGSPALAHQVTVHGTGRRPAVVALPDGVRLVPLGRLRDHRPPFVVFDREATRADLRDAFILPATTAVPDAPPWWRGASAAFAGTAVGAASGLSLTDGSPTGTVALALCGATLLTSVWALSSPQP